MRHASSATSKLTRPVLLAIAALAWGLSGCQNETARVVSAEYLDPGDRQNPFPGEAVILVTLDRPLAESARDAEFLKRVSRSITAQPRVRCNFQVEFHPAPANLATRRLLCVRISGDPAFRTGGIFDPSQPDAGPTGLRIDLGLGHGPQWVDLQPRRSHPALQRAVWDDRNGNLIVDEGDHVRLIFDREVRLDPSRVSSPVRVPEDLILTNQGLGDDRLDDGTVPSRFLEPPAGETADSGGEPRSPSRERIVLIELGSNPRLLPAAHFVPTSRGVFEPIPGTFLRPSGLALHGTPLQAMEAIRDRRHGLGAVSTREVGLELPEDYPFIMPIDESFPGGRGVTFPTATAVFGERVILAGGLRDRTALDRLLVFTPHARPGQQLRDLAPASLHQPRCLHTATLLPGPDGRLQSSDDLLVIAGGKDVHSLATIEVVRLDPETMRYRVEKLSEQLTVARHDHTATRLPGNRILLVGGVKERPLEARGLVEERPLEDSGLVGLAEVLRFEIDADGRVRAELEHWFPTHPRMRHTATDLGPIPQRPGTAAVLIYGGLGAQRYSVETPPARPYGRTDKAAVLASPELVQISGEGGAEPIVVELPLRFDYAHLRYDHAAVLLRGEDGKPLAPPQVFLSGGSLEPHVPDKRGMGQRHRWEIPSDPDEVTADSLAEPVRNECSSSLLFTLDPESPRGSEIEVLRSPTGELRVHHALVPLPGLGALTLGGESPGAGGEALVTTELYLDRDAIVSTFPVFLTAGRTQFAAATISDGNLDIYLFGGTAGRGEEGGLPDVERLRLRLRGE